MSPYPSKSYGMFACSSHSIGLLILIAFMSSIPSLALGQDLPSAAVVRPTAVSDEQTEMASALEHLVRGRVDRLDVVRLSESPALNLEEIQLALGCIGETALCLGQVAEHLEVEVLVIIAVERAGGEVVVTLTTFDARNGDIATAVRRASGEQAESEVLDAVESLVYEVFGLEPPPTQEAAAPQRAPLWATVGVTAAGIVTLAVGAVFGGLSNGSQDAYSNAPTQTPEDVNDALDLADRAESQALTANVLFGIGSTITAGGVIAMIVLLLRERSGHETAEPPRALLSPTLSGLALSIFFEGGLR